MNAGEIFELNTFLAVARAGRFAGAAAELGVIPSAVSQSIRRLEARLDTHLFARTTRSMASPRRVRFRCVSFARSRKAGASPAPPDRRQRDLKGAGADQRCRRGHGVAGGAGPRRILTSSYELSPRYRCRGQADRSRRPKVRRSDPPGWLPSSGHDCPTAERGRAHDSRSRAGMASRTGPLRHPRDLTSERIVISRPRSGAILPWSLSRSEEVVVIRSSSSLVVDNALTARDCAAAGLGVAMPARDFVDGMIRRSDLCVVRAQWNDPLAGLISCIRIATKCRRRCMN